MVANEHGEKYSTEKKYSQPKGLKSLSPTGRKTLQINGPVIDTNQSNHTNSFLAFCTEVKKKSISIHAAAKPIEFLPDFLTPGFYG